MTATLPALLRQLAKLISSVSCHGINAKRSRILFWIRATILHASLIPFRRNSTVCPLGGQLGQDSESPALSRLVNSYQNPSHHPFRLDAAAAAPGAEVAGVSLEVGRRVPMKEVG